MVTEEFSPIELEIQRIAKNIEKVCGSSYQICNSCGEKDKGFSDLREGTFTCIRCYMKKRAEELDTDPEWIKKERLFNMRKARNRYMEKV